MSKLDPASIRQHTLALVQKHDYANYLITSFYPDSESRYDYAAIRAFNIELSNVADAVKSAQLGKLRFQWWREAIASLNTSTPVPHPTVLALHSVMRRRKLPTYHLTRIIDAKERNLLSPAYNTLADLTSYAQSTVLPLLLLQHQILLPQPAPSRIHDIPLSTIDHSLSHLATYIAIAQLVRSIPYFASSNRTLVIPKDIASDHGVKEEQLYRALPTLYKNDGKAPTATQGMMSVEQIQDALQPVIEAVTELVELAELERLKSRWTLGLEESKDEEHRELAQGRRLSRLPKEMNPVFMSAIPAKSFLQQFTKTAHCNPFHPLLRQQQSRNWKLPLQMLYASIARQY